MIRALITFTAALTAGATGVLVALAIAYAHGPDAGRAALVTSVALIAAGLGAWAWRECTRPDDLAVTQVDGHVSVAHRHHQPDQPEEPCVRRPLRRPARRSRPQPLAVRADHRGPAAVRGRGGVGGDPGHRLPDPARVARAPLGERVLLTAWLLAAAVAIPVLAAGIAAL